MNMSSSANGARRPLQMDAQLYSNQIPAQLSQQSQSQNPVPLTRPIPVHPNSYGAKAGQTTPMNMPPGMQGRSSGLSQQQFMGPDPSLGQNSLSIMEYANASAQNGDTYNRNYINSRTPNLYPDSQNPYIDGVAGYAPSSGINQGALFDAQSFATNPAFRSITPSMPGSNPLMPNLNGGQMTPVPPGLSIQMPSPSPSGAQQTLIRNQGIHTAAHQMGYPMGQGAAGMVPTPSQTPPLTQASASALKQLPGFNPAALSLEAAFALQQKQAASYVAAQQAMPNPQPMRTMLEQIQSQDPTFFANHTKAKSTPDPDSGRFGLQGFLSVFNKVDADLSHLALGTDLTSLGLDLNTADYLYKKFDSPWLEQPSNRSGEQYTIPSCYYVLSQEPPTHKIRQFSEKTLFYIFYSKPKTSLQATAAEELTGRGWSYQIQSQEWVHEKAGADGLQVYFDVNAWAKQTRSVQKTTEQSRTQQTSTLGISSNSLSSSSTQKKKTG